MMEDPELDVINASTLRFMADPRELETLRQSMKKFTASNNVEISKFAKSRSGEIDNTFESLGQGLNVDAYNAVARARMAHRVNSQRNDQGTFEIQNRQSDSKHCQNRRRRCGHRH